MKITKLLNVLTTVACLVAAISCSSVQTKVTATGHVEKDAELELQSASLSSNVDSTKSSSPANSIKRKVYHSPNAEYVPSPANPTRPIPSKETDKFLYKRGHEHYRKGEYDQAINDLTEAIHLNPHLSVAYWLRGLSHFNKDQHQQAISDYDMAIKLQPDEPKLYRNRGMVYHKLNLERHAVSDFSEAIKIDSTFSVAYRSRAHSYVTLGRYRDALIDLDLAIHLAPERADLYKDRADIYEKIGLDKQAHSDDSKACSLEGRQC